MNKQTINNYLSLVTSIEQKGTRTIYHVSDRFCVEVRKCCVNLKDKNNVMRLWKKAGYISEVLPSFLSVETFFTDASGNCWGWYNVTEKRSSDGKRRVIDFDYLREATEDNEKELVAECIRMREMDIRPHT